MVSSGFPRNEAGPNPSLNIAQTRKTGPVVSLVQSRYPDGVIVDALNCGRKRGSKGQVSIEARNLPRWAPNWSEF